MELKLGKIYNVKYGIVNLDMVLVKESNGQYTFAEERNMNGKKRITEIVIPESSAIYSQEQGVSVKMSESKVTCYFPDEKDETRKGNFINLSAMLTLAKNWRVTA